jgi:DNA-directed RNA polymerase subunit RPC12/RpoP
MARCPICGNEGWSNTKGCSQCGCPVSELEYPYVTSNYAEKNDATCFYCNETKYGYFRDIPLDKDHPEGVWCENWVCEDCYNQFVKGKELVCPDCGAGLHSVLGSTDLFCQECGFKEIRKEVKSDG